VFVDCNVAAVQGAIGTLCWPTSAFRGVLTRLLLVGGICAVQQLCNTRAWQLVLYTS
jgi:hypothetical protein